MYIVGDKVVHPMHGAGVIDSIVREKINGVYHDYYVFRMPLNGLVLKIPTDNVDTIGVRPIDDCTAIDAFFSAVPGLPVEMDGNWNRRYRENLDCIKSGDLIKVAKVVKGLMYRDAGRGLSTGERKMLYMAKQILISVISMSENVDSKIAEDRINTAIAIRKDVS